MKRRKVVWAVAFCCLAGCQDKAKTEQASLQLEHANQVAPWIESVHQQVNKRRSAQTPDAQSALLTAALPSPIHSVFAMEHAAGKNELPKQIQPPVQTTVKPSWNENLAREYRDIKSSAYLEDSFVPHKAVGLAQASINDLKYAGLLSRDEQIWGMVKIGEHLYPVQTGDKIGQGRWRVIDLNAQTMQIKVGNKAVAYDKN